MLWMNHPHPIFAKIFIVTTVIAAVFGFLICYGNTGSFVFWLCVCLILALLVGKHFGKLAIFLSLMAAGGLILWPIDASFDYPYLRAVIQTHPFGPEISVHPSPSGKCVAYIYNHSFLDSSYCVKFSHGLGFPSNPHFVPGGTLDDFQINPRRSGELFQIGVSGLGDTLTYNEKARKVSLLAIRR